MSIGRAEGIRKKYKILLDALEECIPTNPNYLKKGESLQKMQRSFMMEER